MNKKEIWYTQLYFGLRADILRIANGVWGESNNIQKMCELYQSHIDMPDIIWEE